ncbi:hypothetical protein E2C01_017807 [Portunus trituberculatus]|uniref:Uncharacterized protein n=1 Tax=Portunus trituberculatus TaxID=210409 RepID=A0A5B7DUI5_PORTR|nr:hypothetical protein [Portunus trituberculatus]
MLVSARHLWFLYLLSVPILSLSAFRWSPEDSQEFERQLDAQVSQYLSLELGPDGDLTKAREELLHRQRRNACPGGVGGFGFNTFNFLTFLLLAFNGVLNAVNNVNNNNNNNNANSQNNVHINTDAVSSNSDSSNDVTVIIPPGPGRRRRRSTSLCSEVVEGTLARRMVSEARRAVLEEGRWATRCLEGALCHSVVRLAAEAGAMVFARQHNATTSFPLHLAPCSRLYPNCPPQSLE